ncbi:MAG: alpha/beta fold hydrolase [Planctomycetes bacterium]|nr:alpha/beta fold hydrolase [Planctomycetota bacterium]
MHRVRPAVAVSRGALLAACALFAAIALPARPAAALPLVVRTVNGDACAPWESIECYENSGLAFPQETFLAETEHRASSKHGGGIVEAFGGTARPHSKYFLLHHAPRWREATQPVPVLLVHGAASNATLSFAGTYFDGGKGVMQYLVERGYAVFAVTFPCGQGDLYFMAEHVARAIAIIREKTGAKKVDLVGHSMGGVVVRMVVTGMRLRSAPAPEVRRAVFVATPHHGIDLAFRHPIAYQRFGSYGTPAPWTFYKVEGEITERSIYAPAFRAQQQILMDLTDLHRLSEMEMDWYTTYQGGTGFVSKSKGIREAIKLGGHHMEKLRARPFPRELDVFVLAGKKNLVKYVTKAGQILEEAGEFDGPCDGILFVKSAADEENLRACGARLRDLAVLDLNHVELLYIEEGKAWIESKLATEGAPQPAGEVNFGPNPAGAGANGGGGVAPVKGWKGSDPEEGGSRRVLTPNGAGRP